jgi:Sec-independent protein secretion pathway component TatC
MLNFLIHLKELKFKLYYAVFSFLNTFLICYLFMSQLTNIISTPLTLSINSNDSDFVFSNILEVFNSFILMSAYATFFLCFPITCYFIIGFVKTGLYSYEKSFLYNLLRIVFSLLLMSFFVCYFLLIPYSLSFLFGLDIIHNTTFVVLKSNISLYDYSIFFFKFMFVYSFGIFQIPVIISVSLFFIKPMPLFLFRLRRIWFVLSFFSGFLFSSSDCLSFLFLSFILFSFFEIFVFLCVLRTKYLYLF